MQTLDTNHPIMQTVLDAIGIGVWILDPGGGVVLVNSLARRTMSGGHTLRLAGPLLVSGRPDQQRRFDRALAGARNGHRSMMQLGVDGEARLFAVVPLGSLADCGDTGHILLLCGHRTATEPLAMTLLAKVLGLTQCETHVLADLCDGFMAQDIADRRAVKISTVRTQIACLREKAGVHTVPQLIAKVSSLPPLAGRSLV